MAVDLQQAARDSVLSFTQRFLAFRRENPVFRTGEISFLDGPEIMLLFTRSNEERRLICGFNLSREEVFVPWDDLEGLTNLLDCGLPATRREDGVIVPAFGGFIAE
ncbi:MAG: hypothetical protein AAGJ73_12360 [Pseudomonadota bacterium]